MKDPVYKLCTISDPLRVPFKVLLGYSLKSPVLNVIMNDLLGVTIELLEMHTTERCQLASYV